MNLESMRKNCVDRKQEESDTADDFFFAADDNVVAK